MTDPSAANISILPKKRSDYHVSYQHITTRSNKKHYVNFTRYYGDIVNDISGLRA